MSATTAEAGSASNGGSPKHQSTSMRAYELLGGRQILNAAVTDVLDVHDLIVRGLPSKAVPHLVDRLSLHSTRDALINAIGISSRTLRRRKSGSKETALSTGQGDRTWRFAEVIVEATDLLGSQEAAESWLLEPAIALGGRKPIELLSTSAGTRELRSYMTQLEYGVYI